MWKTGKFYPFHLQIVGRKIIAFSQFTSFSSCSLFSLFCIDCCSDSSGINMYHNLSYESHIETKKFSFFNHLFFSFSLSLPRRMNQPPLSANGSNSLSGRHLHPALNDSDSDSESDISLGTHSPIPSMTSQNSPNSSSGLNDRDLDRLAEEHRDQRGEKDYRNFASLQSFRFGEHINVAGFTSKYQISIRIWFVFCLLVCFHNQDFLTDAFNRHFSPGLPYQLGDNASPTHSPPISLTPSSGSNLAAAGTSLNLNHNQSGYSLPSGLVRPQPQLPPNTMAAMIACVTNGQSNGSSQALLQHHLNHQNNSPLRIRINSPTRLNSSSSTSSNQPLSEVISSSTNPDSPTHGSTQIPMQTCPLNLNETHLARMSHTGQLHRPFEITESSIKKSKENSWLPQAVHA